MVEKKDNLDLAQELSAFIQEIKLAEKERDRQARALSLRQEEENQRKAQEAQERKLFLATGNERGREIIEESGARKLLEQVRIGLAQHYPNAVMAEREEIIEKGPDYSRRDSGKRIYELRLAWGPNPTSTSIRDIWRSYIFWDDPSEELFSYIEVSGRGWTGDEFTDTRKDILRVRFSNRFGLGETLWKEDWQNPDKLKSTILEAIKNPLRVKRLSKPTPQFRQPYGEAHG